MKLKLIQYENGKVILEQDDVKVVPRQLEVIIVNKKKYKVSHVHWDYDNSVVKVEAYTI